MKSWLTKFESRIAEGIFALVCLAYFIRSFFGVSIGDEALLVAIADFPRMGARWFVEEMTVQTTGSILLSPFITAYTMTFGTTGVFLYSRLLYWAVAVTAALLTARFLSRFGSRPVALLFASLMVAFVPHGMSCLNYNSIGMLFFGLGTMLTLTAAWNGSKKAAFWGGVCWVIGVFAYPTALLTFFVFCLTLIVPFWGKRKDFIAFFKPFFTGLVIPSVILICVLLYSGIDNLMKAVELSRHFNLPFNPIKFPDAWGVYKSYWPPLWMWLSIMAVWLAAIVLRPVWAAWGFAAFLTAYIFAGGKGEGVYIQSIWPIAETALIPALVVAWRKMEKDSRALIIHLFIPALFGSLVAMATSRLTVYNMAATAIFATIAGGLVVSRQNRAAAWATALILLSYTFYWQWSRPYEDDSMPKLTYKMESGPYKFLRTNPAKGQAINAVQEELKALPSQTGTIFFQDHFPAGFLMTNLKPKGPTINMLPAFLHPEARPIFADMFSDTKYWPDIVIDFRGFPMTTGNSYYYRDSLGEDPTSAKMKADPFYNFFVRAAGYKIVKDRNLFRVLIRP